MKRILFLLLVVSSGVMGQSTKVTIKGGAATVSGVTGLTDTLSTKAPIANPIFTGNPKISTDTIATKAYARAVGGGSGSGSAILYSGTGSNTDGAMTQGATTTALALKQDASTAATLTGSQTLTNKTLTSPVISTISNTGTITLPTSTGTLALTSQITGTNSGTNTGDETTTRINTLYGYTPASAATAVTLAGTQTLTNKTLTSPVVSAPTGIVKADVGLGNVDNTSDVSKPVSTAQAAADALKVNIADTSTMLANYRNTLATNTGKLATIATGATANSADATLLARANHTGFQAISTVTGLQTALDGKATPQNINDSLMANATTFRNGASSGDSLVLFLNAAEMVFKRLAQGSNFTITKTSDSLLTLSATGDATLSGSQTFSGVKSFSQVVTAPQYSANSQTLTDGATVVWTVTGGSNASITLGGNRTLVVSSATAGATGILKVIQDGTGSRTLTLPASSKVAGGGTGAVTLSTAAAAVDILTFYYDGTSYYWTIGKNYN